MQPGLAYFLNVKIGSYLCVLKGSFTFERKAWGSKDLLTLSFQSPWLLLMFGGERGMGEKGKFLSLKCGSKWYKGQSPLTQNMGSNLIIIIIIFFFFFDMERFKCPVAEIFVEKNKNRKFKK